VSLSRWMRDARELLAAERWKTRPPAGQEAWNSGAWRGRVVAVQLHVRAPRAGQLVSRPGPSLRGIPLVLPTLDVHDEGSKTLNNDYPPIYILFIYLIQTHNHNNY